MYITGREQAIHMNKSYEGIDLFFGRIDIHFVIKIADFGLSEDVYAKNYFRQSGSDKSIKLPVKWMAPESVSDGVFSEKSDVVGFSHLLVQLRSGRVNVR